MAVRAKFRVDRIERSVQSVWDKATGKYVRKEVQTLVMFPVVDTAGGENEQFFASTPSGKIELGTVNAEAVGEFDLGSEFYVEFTPAGKG